jgi:acyl-CoA synthetase (AMP-forming)/AMP-acid ligase II
VQIVGTDGKPLPYGEPGEIKVSSSTVMRGYAGGELTLGTFWTGDIGYLNASGYLFILDRRTDLIISGGENIYPSEVENALSAIPGVDQCCVLGLPDQEWGQIPVALVVGTCTEWELREALRPSLAPYKRPKKYWIVTELPLTTSGKVDRRQASGILNRLNARSS